MNSRMKKVIAKEWLFLLGFAGVSFILALAIDLIFAPQLTPPLPHTSPDDIYSFNDSELYYQNNKFRTIVLNLCDPEWLENETFEAWVNKKVAPSQEFYSDSLKSELGNVTVKEYLTNRDNSFIAALERYQNSNNDSAKRSLDELLVHLKSNEKIEAKQLDAMKELLRRRIRALAQIKWIELNDDFELYKKRERLFQYLSNIPFGIYPLFLLVRLISWAFKIAYPKHVRLPEQQK